MAFKIDKNDNEDLNFVLGCLYSQAIDLAEFKIWVEYVIANTSVESIPLYIFDLMDFNGYLYEISNIVGFVPDDHLNVEEKKSLYGIAFLRGINVYDPPISKDKALKILEVYPSVLENFKRLFPFIELT